MTETQAANVDTTTTTTTTEGATTITTGTPAAPTAGSNTNAPTTMSMAEAVTVSTGEASVVVSTTPSLRLPDGSDHPRPLEYPRTLKDVFIWWAFDPHFLDRRYQACMVLLFTMATVMYEVVFKTHHDAFDEVVTQWALGVMVLTGVGYQAAKGLNEFLHYRASRPPKVNTTVIQDRRTPNRRSTDSPNNNNSNNG